jgi:hypothetical protein
MAKKLRANCGASFVLALLVFLICAMVGAAVITAASAGIQHVQARHRDQQEYLTLSSAAELVAKGVGNLQYEESETKIDHTCNDETTYTSYFGGTVSYTAAEAFVRNLGYYYYQISPDPASFADKSSSTAGMQTKDAAREAAAQALGTAVGDLLAKVRTNPDLAPYSAVLTISLNDSSVVRQVSVKLTMDSGCSLSAELSVPQTEDYKPGYSPFILDFQTVQAAPNPETSTASSDTFDYYYFYSLIGTHDFPVKTTVTKKTTSWQYASLTKGAPIQ